MFHSHRGEWRRQETCAIWTCFWSWWCCSARSALICPLLRQSCCRFLLSRCHPCTCLVSPRHLKPVTSSNCVHCVPVVQWGTLIMSFGGMHNVLCWFHATGAVRNICKCQFVACTLYLFWKKILIMWQKHTHTHTQNSVNVVYSWSQYT